MIGNYQTYQAAIDLKEQVQQQAKEKRRNA